MGYRVGFSRKPIMRGGNFRREDYEEVRSHLTELGKIPLKEIEFDLGDGRKISSPYPAVPETPERITGFTLKTGEGFSGPPQTEVAHIDLLIGLRRGPVADAVDKALMRPDSRSKPKKISDSPRLLIVPTVTIRSDRQESYIYGEAKDGILKAVGDCIDVGELPGGIVDELVMVANVFVHPGASNRYRIRWNNYKAMRAAIRRALESRPTIEELKVESEAFRHPLRYGP